MSCCCESEYPLLGGLLGQAYGRENVVAGSLVRVGFEYKINRSGGYDLSALNNFPDAIGKCLYPYNYFQSVTPIVAPGWINDYVTIQGVTSGDFLFSEDIGELVHQALAECFPFMIINKRDPVIIDAIPQSAAGNPNVAQPGQVSTPTYTGGSSRPTYTGAQQQQPPGKCDWNTMKISDYLACQLGVTPSSAMAYGAIAALLGVVVIAKALK